MKKKAALFILVLLAGSVLWYAGGRVAQRAESNEDFIALYSAAKAARAGRPVYAAGPGSTAAPTQAEEAGGEAPAAPRAGEAAPKPHSIARETGYRHAPHLALMLIPLAFFETPASAALAFYWANVVLVAIAMALATYVLTGRFFSGGKTPVIFSIFAIIPFLIHFLTGACVAVLALVLVLIALAFFRKGLNVVAGVFTALAVYSPLGVAFGAYWFLKRSWKAGLAFLTAAGLLLVIAPMATLGPAEGLSEVTGYWRQAVVPYFSLTAETEALQFPENQSLWAVLMRHTTEISNFGKTAGDKVENVFKVNITRLTSDHMAVVLFVFGALFLIISVLSLCRRLPERDSPVIGLEGALVTLAVLILSLHTTMATMTIVVFPLLAAMWVVRNTPLQRPVHHVSYVALVLSAAFFYLALDPRFKVLGTGLAGVVALWVAMLAAVRRFRPRMVSGRVSGEFAPRREELEKPIDLVTIHSEAEKPPPHGTGVLPLPEFTRRRAEGHPVARREDREMPDFERIKLEEEAEEKRLEEEEKYERRKKGKTEKAAGGEAGREKPAEGGEEEPEETDSAF